MLVSIEISIWGIESQLLLVIDYMIAAAAVVVLSPLLATAATDVSSTRAVLLDIYRATGGDAWSSNAGWQSLSANGDPCDCFGVECTGILDRIFVGGDRQVV